MKKRKSKRRISPQKIFCFISFIFILTCCFWYGGRFVYFYMDSHKSSKEAKVTSKVLATHLESVARQNNKNFKQYKDTYYYYQNATNNYVMYSNLLWRIVKVNKDHSILLISEQPITSLAYGADEVKYDESPIIQWLNDGDSQYSGVLEKKLNDVSNYLVKTSVCVDEVDDVKKISCDKVNKDYYLGLLSVEDYIKTGANKSFIHGKSLSYLANQNKEHEIWYIGEDGSLNESLGDDIIGIRPTITLKSTVQLVSGDGTEKDPYVIEDKHDYFGGYVKLDQDMWRIYDFDDTTVKLVLMDYLKDKDGNVKYKYSNSTYRHNDTIYGSLAYYLNHTYYNSLSYKNLILNGYYYNGYYGEDNNYDLKELFTGKIDTKVALLNVGDVMLNHTSSDFFTSSGISKDSDSVYIYHGNGELSVQKVSSSAYVVPCITIKKDNLKKGSGSYNDPYRTE